ncbi:hypothetical protein A9168_08320 [Macellibacteroides sp. HH-ZS]|nr:hypothetical protein A9168_08320 [Macellibacteroides sp. HH-ZS]
MQEILEIVEVKSTKYVLLSKESYAVLNEKISEVMGFDVGFPTERYAPVVPMLAKVNVQFTEVGEEVNETFDTVPVMQITATVQERCPDLLKGYELVESYVPYVEDVQL